MGRFSQRLLLAIGLLTGGAAATGEPMVHAEEAFRLAVFREDITIPLGHRCMGILPTRAQQVDDALEARGFVLLGSERPLVFVALDWCEVRNESYDAWRRALADAAGTDPQRVLVFSLHQHDAPVIDAGAQRLLDEVGMEQALYDRVFHRDCLQRVARAVRTCLPDARPVTHIGTGKARVERIASNRRVEREDGTVVFSRGSASGGNEAYRQAPEGEIDPWLRTLSFWDGDDPQLALHVYATHPMSFYGRGGVSADFVGMARRMRQRELPRVMQVYASGCSGDVTAGKYNDGAAAMRVELAVRLHDAMRRAWTDTTRYPLRQVEFRSVPLELAFIDEERFREDALRSVLQDEQAPEGRRILAAMGLSSLRRVRGGTPIDFPCVDFGPAQVVLFPGESFVAYQRMAQELSLESFVVSIGYGECWPGYIPTESALREGFEQSWRWVGQGSEARMRAALQAVLAPAP